MVESTLLARIRADPGDEPAWLALSRWLWDNGRDDEAVAVRVFWQTLRDNVAEVELGETLADLTQNAVTLGKLARQIEERDRSNQT